MLEAIVWAIGWVIMVVGVVVGTLVAFLVTSVLAMLWATLFIAGALAITGYSFAFLFKDRKGGTVIQRGPWND